MYLIVIDEFLECMMKEIVTCVLLYIEFCRDDGSILRYVSPHLQ